MSKTKDQLEQERKDFVKEIFTEGGPESLENKIRKVREASYALQQTLDAHNGDAGCCLEVILYDNLSAHDLFERDFIDLRRDLRALLLQIDNIVDTVNQRALSQIEGGIYDLTP